MGSENRLDNMKVVPISEITPEELVTMKYSRETDSVQCPKCHYIIDSDFVEEWGLTNDEYYNMDYDDFDDLTDDGVNKITCPNCNYTDYANKFRTVWTDDIIYAPNCEEIVPGIKKAYDELDENYKKGEGIMENNTKLSLQEATIKALYDGLKDNDEITDIEGLIDDVLVVTDPEITTDEYNEIIERAQEIIEDTPEGDIPLDSTYLGEYLQTCPICGGSFIQDHIYEPGTACPICYNTPESFILKGQLQSADSVAEDNGIEQNNEEETNQDNVLGTSVVNINDFAKPDETENETQNEEEPTPEENEESEETTETEGPIRGARSRRTRAVASKSIEGGTLLNETKEITELNENNNLVEQEDEQPKQDEQVVEEDEYTVEMVFDDKIEELANDSAFTWEGMDYSKENLQAIVDDFKKNTDIILPVHFYVFDGRTMNRMYNLTGDNAYPENLSFVSINLDNWASMEKLPMYKMQVGARWLDDIIENNKARQDMINGNNEED